MLTLADLKFAVFEAGSLWPYTWKRTREEAERVALERSEETGKPHLVESEDEYQARHDAQAFLVLHGLDQRDARNGIGMDQRSTAQIDLGCQLLCSLNSAWFELQCTQRLQPRRNAAQ